MESIRKHIASFLIGILTGGILAVGIYMIAAPSGDEAVTTLDYLISQWTMGTSPWMELHSQAGFKGARPGYIPPIVHELSTRVESLYSIPKGVTTAQWILESKWGQSDLGANNYFGHTYAAVRQFMPKPDYVTAREMVMRQGRMVPGDSVRFARYRNMPESFDVHGIYVTRSTRYRSAFEKKLGPEDFARVVGRSYATDPDYGLKLITIMRRYHLG